MDYFLFYKCFYIYKFLITKLIIYSYGNDELYDNNILNFNIQ